MSRWAALALWLLLVACTPATPTPHPINEATPDPAPPTVTPPPDIPLLTPRRVVATGDVAGWPGGWSPDGRFYVFFRWDADAPCSGESVHAYDTALERDVWLSSEDYCTTDVDPNLLWEGTSTLLLGNGPGGSRWEAITLDDEVTRVTLDAAPPACADRAFPLPPALASGQATRARWSPDGEALALALVPDDASIRFEGIAGNRPERQAFQRLELAVFPANGTGESDLRRLGPIFDLAPDSARDEAEECPGTQIRWSDDGRLLVSSMGPVVYDAASSEALLLPDGPTAGPLGPNVRWSADDRLVADDAFLLDVQSGRQHTPPGILPGYDRGFGARGQLIYVNERGLVAYDPYEDTSRQLTDFKPAIFVVAPDGSRLSTVRDGDLWMLDLTGLDGG